MPDRGAARRVMWLETACLAGGILALIGLNHDAVAFEVVGLLVVVVCQPLALREAWGWRRRLRSGADER